jgi:hypothetical protein
MYNDFFINAGSKFGGTKFEDLINNLFGLSKPNTSNYDHRIIGTKKGHLESKVIRAVRRGKEPFESRALRATDDHTVGIDSNGKKVKIGGFTWQQVKPFLSDNIVGGVVWLDLIRIYFLPTKYISPKVGKKDLKRIYLGRQHPQGPKAGKLAEGTITLKAALNYKYYNIKKNMLEIDYDVNDIAEGSINIFDFIKE